MWGGLDSEQKWGILKYLSAEISSEKSEIIQGPTTRVRGALGQKSGYDTSFCFFLTLHIFLDYLLVFVVDNSDSSYSII